MDENNQYGDVTRVINESLEQAGKDPVDVLYDYINTPAISKPVIFLYYFFDRNPASVSVNEKTGEYTVANAYKGVANRMLQALLNNKNATMSERQSRDTYIKFALYFNSLDDANYKTLFPQSYTGLKRRPASCDEKKMNDCLNAIGEESLNPMILQEAAWILGLGLNFTPSMCDEIIQNVNANSLLTERTNTTIILNGEINNKIDDLKHIQDIWQQKNGVQNFLQNYIQDFKGYSQTRRGAWNILVDKYTGKKNLSTNELYRLLNFRFLYFDKKNTRKTVELEPKVKKVLLPPQYDHFWSIVDEKRLNNTVFWTYMSIFDNESIHIAREQFAERLDSKKNPQIDEQREEKNRTKTAQIVANSVQSMDEELQRDAVQQSLQEEHLTLPSSVHTLRELAQNYAKLEQPSRNMILTLSFAVAVQDAEKNSPPTRQDFVDRTNQYLGLAGYGRLNTKLPLDAALYSCIQDDDGVISLDELYERIINKRGEKKGIRNVDFKLPPAAEIKKILWANRQEIAEKREKTAKQTNAAQNNVPNTVADPAPNYTPNRDHLAHDKRFTELLNRGNSIDFMPINENRHIDPNGLCSGERLVPQDAANVQIAVCPIYLEGKNAYKANMVDTSNAREFLKNRVKDQVNIVAFDVKKNGNQLEARTENIPLNQVQITTPWHWHHDMQNALENPDNPLSTCLEEAIPTEYLGPGVHAPASCRMELTYLNDRNEVLKTETLEKDYHEEYRRYAEACFHAYLPKEAPFHSVFTRLNQKVPDSPHDELYGWIFDEIKKAAQKYRPDEAQFDTFIWGYVLGAIRKCANYWHENPAVPIDAPADDDDANAAAQYRDIEQQIATQSAEDDVLQQLDGQKKNLEDLYNEHKDELLLLERYSLALLCGFDGYDYSQIGLDAYREFLDEADVNAAIEWEDFVAKEMRQFGCTPQEIPIDRVRDHFNLADNDAAKQKKQQANNIYSFLHRQLTPFDIYTVFKSIPALNSFALAKSDIQNFALFGYFKLRRRAT